MQPMNNRQGGRRRGRNNNQRPQGGSPRGGGDSGNRIDSRARGNAAQLLEKYKNLARESQMSGDRVQTEYYLQFADHYFRVLADARSRQEEQRAHRSDDRSDDRYDDDRADIGIVPPFGFGDEGDQSDSRLDEDRDTRSDDRGNRGGRERDGRRPHDDRGDYGNRNDRNDRARSERSDRPERAPRGTDAAVFDGETNGRDSGDDQIAAPVTRRNGLRPRRHSLVEDAVNEDAPASIDHAVLPPAIGAAVLPTTGSDDAAPAPRRRTRSRKVTEEAAAED
jgi:hypothetical protein